MKEYNEKIPNPQEIEKEIGKFLNKKFGSSIKVVSPSAMPQRNPDDSVRSSEKKGTKIDFDLKPKELIAYLDQYIVKQDSAKAVLATKICTHFNRIKHIESEERILPDFAGSIKNNILMIGPTGVGKTYMIKLIAQKIGVPFVKGDATKFSETGYVGGDVEDLVRDLVREADDDIDLARYGIVYIDEIDKIASSRNLVGADVSRTGVQRALLKPMEETDVELKVPHDPVSMIQELDRFQRTGEKNRRRVNTKNILFIMSGAFTDLCPIIRKRISTSHIGFGSRLSENGNNDDLLKQLKSEDLTEFGFESEFIGRLPVRAIFDKLSEKDLFQILKTPNNPIILGKKLDFASYGIDIKFHDEALKIIAQRAFAENTGARGIVGSIENALLEFEKTLPSSGISRLAVTREALHNPAAFLQAVLHRHADEPDNEFNELTESEVRYIETYIQSNWDQLCIRHDTSFSEQRIHLAASYFSRNITSVNDAIAAIKTYYDEIKSIELDFFKKHDINIILEEDAIDFIIDRFINFSLKPADIEGKLTADFEYGLKLVKEKTDKKRFFISKNALLNPENFINSLF